MSGSSGPSKKQEELQARSLALQEKSAASQESFLAFQVQNLKKNQAAPYVPGSPPPTAATAGVDQAGRFEQLRRKSQFGYGRATVGGARGMGVPAY